MALLSDTAAYAPRQDRESAALAELVGVRLLSSPPQLLRARPRIVIARLGPTDIPRFRLAALLAGVGGVILVPDAPAWPLGRALRRFHRILLPTQEIVSDWRSQGVPLARLVVVPPGPRMETRSALLAVLLEVAATTRTADIRPRPR